MPSIDLLLRSQEYIELLDTIERLVKFLQTSSITTRPLELLSLRLKKLYYLLFFVYY